MSHLEVSVLRIVKDNTVHGAAFVVTDDLVVTCAHVIESIGCGINDTVLLQYSDGKIFSAIVVPGFWRNSNEEDLAIIRLKKPINSINQFSLGSSAGTSGHQFSTFGFPRDSQALFGRGEIIGIAEINGKKLLQLRSSEITEGFSGAPVLDEATKRVVGIISSITPIDKYKRLGTTAFAILSETLRDVCTELQITDICPYLSLNSFTEGDQRFFFGRDQIIEKMVESLKHEPRFLAILGPSGSGKSSLVRAGLIPELKQNAIPGSEKWGIITVRTTENPVKQLETSGLDNPQAGIKSAVSKWLKNNPEKERLVLILDQFEEILVSSIESGTKDFIQELINLLSGSSRVTLVIVLRDSFYSRFVQVADSLLNWFEHGLINIPSDLEKSELRSMIIEPAKGVGINFEEDLVEVIIQDTVGSNHSKNKARCTILPLLEFALTQLWQKRSDGLLTNKAYRSIGGVTGGLTQWANQIYSELMEINQAILCRRILSDLVRLGNPETGIPDIRRRVPISALVFNRSEFKEVQNIINRLVNSRLVVTERDQQEEEVVELIHDSLLAEWHLLRVWIDENRNFLTWKQKATERYYDWKNNIGELLYGRELKIAKEYISNYKDRISIELITYIEKSDENTYSRISIEQKRSADLLAANYEILESAKDQPLQEKLNRICGIVQNFTDSDIVIILPLLEGGSNDFDVENVGFAGNLKNPLPNEIGNSLNAGGISLNVLRRGILMISNTDDERNPINRRLHTSDHPFIKGEGVMAMVGLAIHSQDTEKPLGILYLDYRQPHAFSESEKDLVYIFSRMAGAAISNLRRMDELERRIELRTAKEIAETVGTGLNLEKTLEASMEILHKQFDNTRMCVLLYQDELNALKFAPTTLKYYKIHPPEYKRQDTFPLSEKSIACRVAKEAIRTGNIIYENIWDVMSDPDYLPLSPKTQAELCVSLMSTKDELLGILVMESYELHGFDDVDEYFVKTIAQQLSRAIELVQQSDELEFRTTVAAQSAWAADFAHEINNEVGQIRNWAYLLQDHLKEDPELQGFARKIEESASVLSNTGPWSDLPTQVVKLDIFLKRNLRTLTSQRDLQVDFNLSAGVVYINVNPVAFQHILRHLVRNANRAMANSKVRKIIVTTSRPINSGTVEIQFQDTGPGIRKDVQPFIFQRPITTKGSGGFGLLLVRQMIEDMGGQIRYMPQIKRKGAVFSIRFPIASIMDGTVE